MIRTRILAAMALACLALAGCVGHGGGEGAPTAIQGIEDDQFSPRVTINGAKVIVYTDGINGYTWFIRSFVDKKSRAVAHQLYFEVSHDPPRRHFLTAFDDTAKKLPLQTINAETDCSPPPCTDDETAVIPIDQGTLNQRLLTGYNVKISMREGYDYVLDFGANAIQLQFEAVSKVLASPAVASAPAAPAQPAPRFGIHFTDLAPNHPAKLRFPGLIGIQVVAVDPGSPAARAGIVAGDVIADFNGAPIGSEADLRAVIDATAAGHTVEIGVYHWTAVGRVSIQVQM